MTTLLHVPFHPHATDQDIVEAIAETMRESRATAVPGAWRIIVERLSDYYGRRIVDRAVNLYMRKLRRERRSLKRQVKQVHADWLKRQ